MSPPPIPTVHNANSNIYITQPEHATSKKFEQDGFFNLSNQVIPIKVANVLNLGLKHIPCASYAAESMQKSTVAAIERSLRLFELRLHFAMEDGEQVAGIPKIDGNIWRPPESKEDWWIPFQQFSTDLLQKVNDLPFTKMTTKAHDDDIVFTKQWLEEHQCIVKPSDKNLGPCILHKELYITLCNAHLNVTKNYSNLGTCDATPYINRMYGQLRIVLSKHGMLKNSNSGSMTKLANSLLQLQNSDRLRLAIFYVLPKVHKLSKENPDLQQLAGRPIVSNTNSHSYHASKYLHNIMAPLLVHVTTIVASSSDALQRMRSSIVQATDTVFCADVKALYPSIPTAFGLAATRAFLYKYAPPSFKIDLIIDLLNWVLCSNYFGFNNILYHQENGTAMGTPVAPTYANIVLFQIERDLVIHTSPRLYMRYLDDLFGIFKEQASAEAYVHAFNNICPGIQLESITYGDNGIFLDIQGCIDTNRIKTKLYQKPMNRYLYIKPHSKHQRHVFKNFIRAEICRYRLYCSDDIDYNRCVQLFHQRLISRGYNYHQIAEASFNLPCLQEMQERASKKTIRPTIGPIFCLPPFMKRMIQLQPDLLHMHDQLTSTRHYITAYKSANKVLTTYSNDPSIGRMITRSKFD